MNAEITNPLNLFLLILGTYLAIKLGSFLLSNKSTKHNANLYLAALVISQSLSFFVGTFFRFDLLVYVPHIIGFQHLAHFLLGPLAYLYVRACTQEGFQLRPILWLHFLPFVLDIFFNMPFFLQSGVEKIAFYNQLVQGGQIYSPKWLNAIKSFHAIVYFVLAIRLILQYRKHLNDATSSVDTAFHRWLLFFIFIVALPIIVLIAFAFTEYSRAYTVLIYLLGISAFLVSLDLATIYKPELFHAFPHQMPTLESTEVQKQKYENSKLQTAQKTKYIEKLKDYMEQEKPYRATDLTLAQLSEQVKIPPHYLSQVINEKLDCNFLDFVNGYRVEAAKTKLVNPKLSHYTIMAIAYEAGFNSKSTFYAAFKKHAGMTPSQYRKQLT